MIKTRYEWRELSSDGLLKEISEQGPYYDRNNINKYGGFDSKEDAVQALELWNKEYIYSFGSNIVLVEFSYLVKE